MINDDQMTSERSREASRRDTAGRLRALDTSGLSDALDALGLPGAAGGLSPLGPHRRIAGRARTVSLDVTKPGVVVARHLGTTAIEDSEPGDVIVVAHRSTPGAAGWGGLLSVAAQQRGVVGVVIDGSARDLDDYDTLDFPVYGRAGTPVSARGRVAETATGEPVEIAGQTCRPGDWVVADRSGCVVIPVEHLAEVLDTAERLAERERLMAADLRRGEPAPVVLGRDYETMLNSRSSRQRKDSAT